MEKKPSAKRSKSGNHLKQDISMLALMSNQNTHGCRKYLKKIGKDDCKNHLDLELSLAEVYKAAPDKLVVEKEFASLHPHKDFILKHLAPTPTPEETIIIENPDEVAAAEQSKQNIVDENFHNCCGGVSSADGSCNCRSCQEKKSNSCGSGYSSFSGAEENKKAEKNIDITIIGLVSVVALFGMVIIMKK